MNKKIIVFAPHPDDETLGCGGTIAKKIAEGYEVIVVVMTDGRNSLFKDLGIESDPSPEELKEIRKDEVKRATKILGLRVENLLFLDFVDGTLDKCESEAQDKVTKILRDNTPLETYYPHEKDCHPDHRATNRIVRNVIGKNRVLVTKWRYMIAHKYARIGPLIGGFLDLFRRGIVRIDVSKYLSLKKTALNEFRSELSIISTKQSRPRTKTFMRFLKRREKFYIDS